MVYFALLFKKWIYSIEFKTLRNFINAILKVVNASNFLSRFFKISLYVFYSFHLIYFFVLKREYQTNSLIHIPASLYNKLYFKKIPKVKKCICRFYFLLVIYKMANTINIILNSANYDSSRDVFSYRLPPANLCE